MKIFISYAHVDKYIVNQLVEILRSSSLEPWFDHRLIVGRDWKEQLEEAILQCDSFLYALSPESVTSEWCQWEFALAVKLGKPIIPVLIQGETHLPEALGRYQYADFTEGPSPQGVARLIGGLWAAKITIPKDQRITAPNSPSEIPAQAIDSTSVTASSTMKSEVEIASELAKNAMNDVAYVWEETWRIGAIHVCRAETFGRGEVFVRGVIVSTLSGRCGKTDFVANIAASGANALIKEKWSQIKKGIFSKKWHIGYYDELGDFDDEDLRRYVIRDNTRISRTDLSHATTDVIRANEIIGVPITSDNTFQTDDFAIYADSDGKLRSFFCIDEDETE